MLHNKLFVDLSAWSPFETIPWASSGSLVVIKKSYPQTTTQLTVDMNSVLGGGTIDFTCSPIYAGSVGWGPYQLFDDQQTINDWVATPDSNCCMVLTKVYNVI